jgi:hypothetical protein
LRNLDPNIEVVSRKVQANRTCLVIAKQGDTTHAVEKGLALDGDAFLGLARNNLPVVRIVALDELGNQLRAVQLKRHEVFADSDLHFLLLAEQALELGHGFCRNDEIAFVAVGKFQIAIEKCQTATIRRHERKLVFLKREKNAIQHIACLVDGNGVGSPAQPIFKLGLPDCVDFRVFEGWERGEFLLREAVDLEEE